MSCDQFQVLTLVRSHFSPSLMLLKNHHCRICEMTASHPLSAAALINPRSGFCKWTFSVSGKTARRPNVHQSVLWQLESQFGSERMIKV